MMHYRTIDMNTCPRRARFDDFHSLQSPMLGVIVDVDVTTGYIPVAAAPAPP